MDVVAAYRDVGTFRGAAEMCGVDPKTVKRKVLAHAVGELDDERAGRAAVAKNTDGVRDLVAERVAATRARMSAKRLLPVARAAGYTGSPRNFRRVVATEKRAWRATQARHQRRPAVWVPGDTVVIDWGTLPDGTKVFCAVVAWCRFRFVRYARDETAATTMALLAACFETIGGTPAKVLADRMGCLKGGVVANVVIPTPDYVRFATHYGFRPDFCHPADPESKGIVEHLVGYAKRDIPIPAGDGEVDLVEWNRTAASWCDDVNAAVHTETCAVPRRTARGGAAVAAAVAVAAATHRTSRGAHRRQAVDGAGGIGALLGPIPADRPTGRDRHLRRRRPRLRRRRPARRGAPAARRRGGIGARRALPDTPPGAVTWATGP